MKIVDGVDVSGCTDYCINKCFDEPNCTFKKLKRCEQKLEKIKEIVVANYSCKCALEELMNVFIEGAENE